jgi:hypothetical protein
MAEASSVAYEQDLIRCGATVTETNQQVPGKRGGAGADMRRGSRE